MKTIYKILLLTMLFHTAVISQVEVLGIVKPSGVDQCDGTINLEFVESELPYDLEYLSTTDGQQGSYQVTTTVFSITGLCAGTISISATDNHGCVTELDPIELEECGDIDVSYIQEDEECDYAGINLIATVNEGEGLQYTWSNGQTTKDLINVKPGTYSVSIVDAFNCKKEYSFNIKRPFIKDYSYPTSKYIDDGFITVEATGIGEPYILKLFDSKGNNLYTTIPSEFSSGVFTFPVGLWYDTYKIIITNNFGCERTLFQTFNGNNCNLKVKLVNIERPSTCLDETGKCCNDQNCDGVFTYDLIGDNTNLDQYIYDIKKTSDCLEKNCNGQFSEDWDRVVEIKSSLIVNNVCPGFYVLSVFDKDNSKCNVNFWHIMTVGCTTISYNSSTNKCITKTENRDFFAKVDCIQDLNDNSEKGKIVFRFFRYDLSSIKFELRDPNGEIINNYKTQYSGLGSWSDLRKSYRKDMYSVFDDLLIYDNLTIPGKYCLSYLDYCGYKKNIYIDLKICYEDSDCKKCEYPLFSDCLNGIQDGDETAIDCGGYCAGFYKVDWTHDPVFPCTSSSVNTIGNKVCDNPECIPELEHCINGECYQICSNDSECPSGYECKHGYCQPIGSTVCIPPCPDGQVCDNENGNCMVALCGYSVEVDDGYTVDYEQYLYHNLHAGDEVEITKLCKGNGTSVEITQGDVTLWSCGCEIDCSNQPMYFNLIYDKVPVKIKVFPGPITAYGACIGYDQAFCINLFCINGFKNDISSTEVINNINNIQISPNPFNSSFTINSVQIKIKKVAIINTVGQLIKSRLLEQSKFQTSIDLKNEPTGVFYLKILLENDEIVTKKIVKSY